MVTKAQYAFDSTEAVMAWLLISTIETTQAFSYTLSIGSIAAKSYAQQKILILPMTYSIILSL
jgi:hypothetical protein